jgi:hypothetical protein
MSITEQNRTNPTRVSDPDVTNRRTPSTQSVHTHTWRETKPSPKTTELWLTIIGVVALVVIYNASSDASLNLFRACLLGTVMAAAYIVSRGFAKAGSHDDDEVAQYQREY